VNQAAFNLVAILVFAMVLSVLLGPLLQIPPALPALAVFAVLGLGTIDTLGWQGRGSTLLLDWLAGFSSEHRDRVLHHEAGHFLVAHHQGIPVTGYTLSAWEAFRQGQPGSGGVSFDTQALAAELDQGSIPAQLVDQYCAVWMAGIAAETLVYGNAEGGQDDRQTIRNLWKQLQRSSAESETKQRWGVLHAKTILENNRAAYDALVVAMQQREPVERCLQAIAASKSPSTEGV
jgi:hypothetical protein